MITKVYAWWCWFWTKHIQKTLGTILGGSALFDLMSALGLYETTLTQILGLHLYSMIRGACALGIVLRAVIKPRPPE